MKGCDFMSLNGGYAMIKHNSTQEELQIAYRSKKPVLFYDENQMAHWAVIEETTVQSVDEETQESITLYEYSYKLLDEASTVVANPTLSGDEATLNGLEVDGTKYKVGGGSEVHLYRHQIHFEFANSAYVNTIILNNSNSPFTALTLLDYLSSYTDYNNYYLAFGTYYKQGNLFNIYGVFKSSNNSYPFGIVASSSTLSPQTSSQSSSPTSFTDNITEVL